MRLVQVAGQGEGRGQLMEAVDDSPVAFERVAGEGVGGLAVAVVHLPHATASPPTPTTRTHKAPATLSYT
jgi:hypothetical protein